MSNQRKKVFILMLALVIAMAMLAGCGGKKGATDSVSGSDAVWPKADLPSGFPEYTDGTVIYVGTSDKSISITIKDTSQGVFDTYMADVEKAGYVFDDVTETGYYYAKKSGESGYALILSFNSDRKEAIVQYML